MQDSLVTTIGSKKKAPISPASQQESALPLYGVTTKSGELQASRGNGASSISPAERLRKTTLLAYGAFLIDLKPRLQARMTEAKNLLQA